MDELRVYQALVQFGAKPHYEKSELLPDRDGSRSGTWGVHSTITSEAEYHEAINSLDVNQDWIPDGWPPSLTFMPEYVFLDNPKLGDYIDFHLKSGNGAYSGMDHEIVVYTQTIEEDPDDSAYYGIRFYQGNPASGGTLIYDSGNSYAFGDGWASYPNTPLYESVGEGTILDIPEGYTKAITNYEDLWVRVVIDPSRYSTPLVGRVAIGRIVLRYPAPSRSEGPGYTSFLLDGVDRTDMIVTDSMEITKDLQNRSTMEVLLRDDTATLHPQPGEVVYFFFEDRCIFGGKVESVDEELPGCLADSPLLITLHCVDWSRLLDRFTVSDSWEGETLEEIVRQIFVDNTPLVAEEGIVLGPIAGFNFITKVNARREKVSEILRDLCNLAGFHWSIHPFTRILEIREWATYQAPWTIGDGFEDYRQLRLSRSLDQYRNVQWLLGGKAETTERTEYHHGHPATDEATRPRTFVLDYPVAKEPSIWVDRGAGEVAQRVGVRSVDKDGNIAEDPTGWKQWFWARDTNEISQNSDDDAVNNPTLQTDDVLKVTYTGLFPVNGFERNDAGIAERARVEGGSGIYEDLVDDTKTDSLDLAEDRCLRLLAQFGRVPETLTYEIDFSGLEPGMIQTITVARLAVDADFLIEELTIRFPDPQMTVLRCRVKALDGERQEGWVDYWRKAGKAGREFSLNENETVGIFQGIEDTVDISDVLEESIHNSVTPPAWYDDPFSVALYGIRTIDGVQYSLSIYGRSRYGEPLPTS